MDGELQIDKVPAGHGWAWIKSGFALFKQTPGLWIAIVVVLFLLQAVVNLVPLGGLLMGLLSPVFTAGILFGCRDLERGDPLQFAHLFEGFRSSRAGALVLLGLSIMILFALFGMLMLALVVMMAGGVDLEAGMTSPGLPMTLALVGLVLVVPVLMAIWFATPLVALGELDPLAALKASFSGCAGNLGPLTVYGLVLIPLGLLAMIPMGLGLLILAPTMMAASYCSYVDIFGLGVDSEADKPAPSLID